MMIKKPGLSGSGRLNRATSFSEKMKNCYSIFLTFYNFFVVILLD